LVLSDDNNNRYLRYRCMERIQICIPKQKKNEEEITIREFADRLAFELINNNFDCGASDNKIQVLSPLTSPQRRSPRLMRLNKRVDAAIEGNLVVVISEASVSPLTSNQTKSTASKKIQAEAIWI
jgi:hypothetical protein